MTCSGWLNGGVGYMGGDHCTQGFGCISTCCSGSLQMQRMGARGLEGIQGFCFWDISGLRLKYVVSSRTCGLASVRKSRRRRRRQRAQGPRRSPRRRRHRRHRRHRRRRRPRRPQCRLRQRATNGMVICWKRMERRRKPKMTSAWRSQAQQRSPPPSSGLQ